jgi:hypothetical protein
MVRIPSFVKIGTGFQKLLRGICIQTHREQDDLISLLLFFQIRK